MKSILSLLISSLTVLTIANNVESAESGIKNCFFHDELYQITLTECDYNVDNSPPWSLYHSEKPPQNLELITFPGGKSSGKENKGGIQQKIQIPHDPHCFGEEPGGQ